jgi:hypothetical protein
MVTKAGSQTTAPGLIRGTRRMVTPQLGAQLDMVADLAVVRDDVAPVGRAHWLMTGWRQVDDRQPTMSESDAGLGVNPDPLAIRAAMSEAVGHRPGLAAQDLGRGLCQTID